MEKQIIHVLIMIIITVGYTLILKNTDEKISKQIRMVKDGYVMTKKILEQILNIKELNVMKKEDWKINGWLDKKRSWNEENYVKCEICFMPCL